MRRIAAILTALLLILSLSTAVSASSASRVQVNAVVSTDGTCQVSMMVNLTLDSVTDSLSFPLPANARGVTVNGTHISTTKSGGVLYADVSRLVKGLTGQFTLMFNFSLSGCVETNDQGKTIVTVPLLCGFVYPVDSMDFTVTLPEAATAKPTFTSGYYESSIESTLEYSVSGQTITGYSTKTLKDLETLSMSIEMPTELFPQQQAQEWSVVFDDIAMYVCAALALLYWLFFLRCLPPRRIQRAIPPDGLNAGEMGSALTAQGTDLTMMVLSWAQLGYVLIHVDRHGRVMLHKRMDMGNERSAFENKIFRALFGKKDMVDGTGYPYARLCRKVARSAPAIQGFFRPGSGNTKIFRILACGIGLFGGMSLGLSIGKGAVLVGFMVFVMITFGAISSWLIQSGAYALFLRGKQRLWIALGCIAAWVLLGIMAGHWIMASIIAAAQFLAGLAAAYGGRRNELGRQAMGEVLGLRRYLKNAPQGEFQRISRNAPDHFFSLAPHALALGVEEKYARQFGTMQLPGCPYLTTGHDGHMTALEWVHLMNRTITQLDARQKRLTIERLLPPR